MWYGVSNTISAINIVQMEVKRWGKITFTKLFERLWFGNVFEKCIIVKDHSKIYNSYKKIICYSNKLYFGLMSVSCWLITLYFMIKCFNSINILYLIKHFNSFEKKK